MKCNRHGLERTIPADRARKVRRRCAFACVMCRSGLIEYHHFRPEFADATRHDPEGITLLCARHHDEVTRGHIAPIQVEEADAVRRRDGLEGAETGLSVRRPPLVLVGPLLLSGDLGTLLRVNGEPVLELREDDESDRGLLLSARLRDDRGALKLTIENNVITARHDNWDVRDEGAEVTVNSGRGKIWLRLKRWPPHGLHIRQLRMRFGGWSLDMNNRGDGRIVRNPSTIMRQSVSAITVAPGHSWPRQRPGPAAVRPSAPEAC